MVSDFFFSILLSIYEVKPVGLTVRSHTAVLVDAGVKSIENIVKGVRWCMGRNHVHSFVLQYLAASIVNSDEHSCQWLWVGS